MFRKHRRSGLMVALAVAAACNQPARPADEPAHHGSDEQQRRSGAAAAAQAPAAPEDRGAGAGDAQPLGLLGTAEMAERGIAQIDAFAEALRRAHARGDVETAGRDVVVKGRRVIGGELYEGLPAIGAILLRDKLHCTGTVIGSQTVLTAAHCLHGYDERMMSFVTGPDAFDRDAPRYRLIDKRIHQDYIESPLGTHDIGVIYLARPFGEGPVVPLPTEDVSSIIVSKKLSFIGYGYTRIQADGSHSDNGQKMKADMAARGVAEWTFSYGGKEHSTCNGDSGGPALLGTPETELRVVGVTSWGDGACSEFGVNMRVDKYTTWLNQNMR
jgi:V8-like Glu-specific endopeptidase